MSDCYCGQVEIPLGMTMCKDPRPQHHVVHGVTACVSAGTDWEKRAKQAEATIQRVREVIDHDGYTVTLPTANWDTQLQSHDSPYRAEVVLSADVLEALDGDA